jgi:hypothetical protein
MAPQPPSSTLFQASGLGWPRPAIGSWPPDRQIALATLLALPVWLALGLLFGPHLRAPVGWLAWASLVLVQPFLEELVFRGLLQGQALAWLQRGGRPDPSLARGSGLDGPGAAAARAGWWCSSDQELSVVNLAARYGCLNEIDVGPLYFL